MQNLPDTVIGPGTPAEVRGLSIFSSVKWHSPESLLKSASSCQCK